MSFRRTPILTDWPATHVALSSNATGLGEGVASCRTSTGCTGGSVASFELMTTVSVPTDDDEVRLMRNAIALPGSACLAASTSARTQPLTFTACAICTAL